MYGVKFLRGRRIQNLNQNMLLNETDITYRTTKKCYCVQKGLYFIDSYY